MWCKFNLSFPSLKTTVLQRLSERAGSGGQTAAKARFAINEGNAIGKQLDSFVLAALSGYKGTRTIQCP